MRTLSAKIIVIIILLTGNLSKFSAQDIPDWEGGIPDGCTTVTAGKMATADGSVITSHTDDSHRTRSWINIVNHYCPTKII